MISKVAIFERRSRDDGGWVNGAPLAASCGV
jgi:hypothetical protein